LPVFKPADNITNQHHRRYRAAVYLCGGNRLRISSDWKKQNRQRFLKYVHSKDIIDEQKMAEYVAMASMEIGDGRSKSRNAKSKGRYGARHVGDIQNLVMRVILSNLGDDQFSAQDWADTVLFFGGACAYCSQKTDELVREHATPITINKLGEHKTGNIVPSCKSCNSKKSEQDFVEFLGGDDPKAARIFEHMRRHNYTPIGNNDELSNLLESARREVGEIVAKYVRESNLYLAKQTGA